MRNHFHPQFYTRQLSVIIIVKIFKISSWDDYEFSWKTDIGVPAAFCQEVSSRCWLFSEYTFYDLELIHKVAQPSTILPPGIIGIV